MYRAVLLDVYGTLVHDDETWATEAAAGIAARSGADPDDVARYWSARIWAMAGSAHGPDFRRLDDLDAASLAETAAHFGTHAGPPRYPAGLPAPYPDSLPFLAAAGLPVCLVSDADRDRLEPVLHGHGITAAAVVTSEDARAYKPRPEPFRMALRLLGLAAGDVLHIGDSPAADLAGANNLGIDTAFVRRDARPLPPGVTATYTVDTLTGLLPVLGDAR
ncbi:HAD family hydrolase [Pseudosporangium ferrugineum]|uniref:2-haloacid dehalogenase/putative hydrolase of the HAD superfamily n=1 Tax=Pseudosporangium ferrugineum TaxID=439699 RepID=A0A2T0SHI4_9ACTN|nr:HAD family hydrolase [Pseudosporangium ferrugineum]PRY32878.1 2-haloacid dehalogenase/putative hydrolase of the HAD superfamily [Pseudosporangium ferrugineum]